MDEHRLAETVRRSWLGGFSLQSDFARTHAPYVAAAASMGLITTKVGFSTYQSVWRPTSAGIRMLEDYDNAREELQLELAV